MDDFGESGAESLEAEGVERALEDRVLQTGAVGFADFSNAAQAAGVADVVADEEPGAHLGGAGEFWVEGQGQQEAWKALVYLWRVSGL